MTVPLFTACGKKEETKSEATEVSAETAVPETETPAATEPEYLLDKEDPVFELYSEKKEDFYEYHVPQLNCGTEEVRELNRHIEDVFGKAAREGIEAGMNGINTGCYEIDYTVHWYGDVLVLILWKQYSNDFREYEVCSISRVTGCPMTNDDILKMLKIDPADLIFGARKGAEAYYRDYYPEDTMGGDSLYQEELDWTLSEENINMDMRMFPAEDGRLMLISRIGSLAGAEYYEQIYAFEP